MRKIDGEKKPNILASVAKKGMQNMIIIAALAVLVLIFWALNPNFLNKFNIVSMAQSLAPYASRLTSFLANHSARAVRRYDQRCFIAIVGVA